MEADAGRPLAVLGLGVAGAFGSGAAALERALAGEAPAPAAVRLRGAGQGEVRQAYLVDLAPLERFVPKRALRRLDRFSRLAQLGGRLCLEDAGLGPEAAADFGLVLATGYGATATTFSFLDSCIDDGDALASPTHFSNSVHNAAAAHLAILLGIRGPSCTVSQFGHSFAMALATARGWLQEGRVSRVLLGAVDEVCDVLAYCHGRLGAPEASLPGEGAAFFLLGEQDAGAGRGAAFGRAGLMPESFAPPAAEARIEAVCGSGLAGLYGSMPTGQALDAAAAVLFQEQGELQTPDGTRPLAAGEAVHCVSRQGGAAAWVEVLGG